MTNETIINEFKERRKWKERELLGDPKAEIITLNEALNKSHAEELAKKKEQVMKLKEAIKARWGWNTLTANNFLRRYFPDCVEDKENQRSSE